MPNDPTLPDSFDHNDALDNALAEHIAAHDKALGEEVPRVEGHPVLDLASDAPPTPGVVVDAEFEVNEPDPHPTATRLDEDDRRLLAEAHWRHSFHEANAQLVATQKSLADAQHRLATIDQEKPRASAARAHKAVTELIREKYGIPASGSADVESGAIKR